MTSIKGGPGIIIINVTDVVSVVCPDFKNAVGEMLAMVRQELERVGQKFSALGFVEQLAHSFAAGITFDEDELLRCATFLSVRRRDGVERGAALDRHAVNVLVDGPPKTSSLKNDESVKEISESLKREKSLIIACFKILI